MVSSELTALGCIAPVLLFGGCFSNVVVLALLFAMVGLCSCCSYSSCRLDPIMMVVGKYQHLLNCRIGSCINSYYMCCWWWVVLKLIVVVFPVISFICVAAYVVVLIQSKTLASNNTIFATTTSTTTITKLDNWLKG
jgi:hypothetical protein